MDQNKQPAVPRLLVAVLVVLYLASLAMYCYGNYTSGAQPWQIATSALLLSIPLVALFFSIGLLVVAGRQRRRGQISGRVASLLYWTPRVAGILVTLFVGMFALDAFSEGGSFWEMLGAFLIHSIPTIILAVVLALAWRWEWVGFVAFSLAAIFFLRFLLGNPLQGLGNLLLFSAPLAVIALLFGLNWRWRGELRPGQKPA